MTRVADLPLRPLGQQLRPRSPLRRVAVPTEVGRGAVRVVGRDPVGGRGEPAGEGGAQGLPDSILDLRSVDYHRVLPTDGEHPPGVEVGRLAVLADGDLGRHGGRAVTQLDGRLGDGGCVHRLAEDQGDVGGDRIVGGAVCRKDARHPGDADGDHRPRDVGEAIDRTAHRRRRLRSSGGRRRGRAGGPTRADDGPGLGIRAVDQPDGPVARPFAVLAQPDADAAGEGLAGGQELERRSDEPESRHVLRFRALTHPQRDGRAEGAGRDR